MTENLPLKLEELERRRETYMQKFKVDKKISKLNQLAVWITDKVGSKGFFVIIFINPPTASDPYKDDAGPFTISILSTKLLGMPDRPYTVDKLLTIGIPSISTIV